MLLVCGMCGGSAALIKDDYKYFREAPFENPPDSLNKKDLVGVWEVEYSHLRNDKLIIREDGKYKQYYYDDTNDRSELIYESTWEDWWIERLPDGCIYLHLNGGQYFIGGKSFAKMIKGIYPCTNDDLSCTGIGHPWSSYDRIRDTLVDMSSELILHVRITSFGEILLLHMASGVDSGFPLIGAESQFFRKTN
jgi:hypothetical protein